jgi:spermidine/putrescine-binding protein
MVESADVEGIDNPWDVFWNTKYSGITGLYDDFRETLSMVLLRNGVADPKNASAEEIEAAGQDLADLVESMNIRYSIDGVYSGIPEGRFGLHLSWSGDVVASPYYWAEDADPSITRYLWPARADGSAKAQIANDTITVLRTAEHPVLAHQFLDFMLNEDNALENFGWNGYQPPQNGLDVSLLVADEWVVPYLESAVVLPEDFGSDRSVVPTQLTAEQETRFNDAWSVAKAGG